MATQMTATQKFTASVRFVDKKGNDAQVDEPPTWATDSPAVLALTPSADGMSCDVAATGVLGVASLQVTADADLGDGSTPIIGTMDVEVTPGEAATVEISAGAPVEQE